ncbi:MAG: thymidine kinase [Microgenomates group bacterium]
MRTLGYLEVIAGPMYCGKTEELIRQVKRATIGKKHVLVFKHAIDTRYGADKKVHSHAGGTFTSELIHSASEIFKHLKKNTEIIAIDEAQWFGIELIAVVETLLSQGKHVIIAGLAMTFDRQPFVPIPTLMTMADKVTKLSAVCSLCGEDAVFHKRVVKGKSADALSTDPTLVNKLEDNVYEARCRNCFSKK